MLQQNLMQQGSHLMMQHLNLNNMLQFFYHLPHDMHILSQQPVVLELLFDIIDYLLNGDETVTLLSYFDP